MSDWLSERVLFGLLIIGGFLAVAIMGMVMKLDPTASADQLTFGKEALDVFGPIAGMIAAAIWKTDRTDKQNAQTLSNLTTAVNTALASTPPGAASPPPAPAPAPAPPAPNPVTGETGTDPRIDAATGLPKGPISYVDLKDVEANLWPTK
jgi:hypothetical protein